MGWTRSFKHLEFILGVVNGLAMDSFRIKGWAVTLVALSLCCSREVEM